MMFGTMMAGTMTSSLRYVMSDIGTRMSICR